MFACLVSAYHSLGMPSLFLSAQHNDNTTFPSLSTEVRVVSKSAMFEKPLWILQGHDTFCLKMSCSHSHAHVPSSELILLVRETTLYLQVLLLVFQENPTWLPKTHKRVDFLFHHHFCSFTVHYVLCRHVFFIFWHYTLTPHCTYFPIICRRAAVWRGWGIVQVSDTSKVWAHLATVNWSAFCHRRNTAVVFS